MKLIILSTSALASISLCIFDKLVVIHIGYASCLCNRSYDHIDGSKRLSNIGRISFIWNAQEGLAVNLVKLKSLKVRNSLGIYFSLKL